MATAVDSKFKFAANISTMFNNEDIVDRLHEAKNKGFKYIEAQFLQDAPIDRLYAAKTELGLEFVLMNSDPGSSVDIRGYSTFGYACLPGEEATFLSTMMQDIRRADQLGCKRIHILSGLTYHPCFTDDEYMQTYIGNLKAIVEVLDDYNVTGVIEPICSQTKPCYFMNSYEKAVYALGEIGTDRIKLLLDVYHMQMLWSMDIEGDVVKYLPYADHVQISQIPCRNEPFSRGAINYEKIFKILEEEEYKGFIGLEYTPTDSVNAFEWLKRYGICPS